jgi:hypothetical protein
VIYKSTVWLFQACLQFGLIDSILEAHEIPGIIAATDPMGPAAKANQHQKTRLVSICAENFLSFLSRNDRSILLR